MGQIAALVPLSWYNAAMQVHVNILTNAMTPPTLSQALAVIMPRLGWRLQAVGHKDRVLFLKGLSVKDATALQLSESRVQRLRAHTCFIHEAYDRGEEVGVAREEIAELLEVLSQCWSLKWDNDHKEIYWRVCVDGVADGHRWGGVASQPCGCGHPSPRRGHYFWSCPVAKAVIQVVQQCWPGQAVVSRASLWLMQAGEGVPIDSWRVVCMAALNGMDTGRTKLLSLKLSGTGGDDPEYGVSSQRRGQQGTARVRSRADRLNVAKCAAISDFWERIQNFVVLKGMGRRQFFQAI